MRNDRAIAPLARIITLAILIYLISTKNFVTRLCKPGFLNVVLHTNKVRKCAWPMCESALKLFVTRLQAGWILTN